MKGEVFMVIVCLISLTSAWFFGKDPEWNGLVVKFGLNPFDSTVTKDLPRTVSAAEDDGWTRVAGCNNQGVFRGQRYVKGNDYAVVLLFDVNGYIAGIQCGIHGTSSYPPMKQRGNIFQQDGRFYVLTAYFTDPAIICTTGRSESTFAKEGTGSDLYIQNGSDPVTQSVRIPHDEAALVDSSWTLGKCFPIRMGVHYWYNVTEDMDCNDFQPVFLLYNKDKLNAFGWALGSDQTSTRFEHPTFDKIDKFMKPVPQCLQNYPRLSTMHIYLTEYPTLNFC